MTDFTQCLKHLENDSRRQELLNIESKLEEAPFPPQLVIENTSYCNMRCMHCSHKEMKRKNQHMTRELHDKIVEEVGKESPNCEIWPTFYGEALILGDELWDRLDYTDKVGCKNQVLNSNGLLLHKNNNIQKIIDSPLKRFLLSLDGYTEETFEKIRYGGKRNKIYAAVEELCRKKSESNKKYPVIIVQFSVMKENAAEAEDFSKHWKKFGAEVKIRPMLEWCNVGSIKTDTIIHDTDFRIACPWGINTMAILSDGTVSACAIDYEGHYTAGNINDNSIKEIWQKMSADFRKVHLEHRWDELPQLCKNCGDWQTAGATYEQQTIEGTRPFWFKD